MNNPHSSGAGQSVAAPFSVAALAEVATKAVYTHGFGFRAVLGPHEKDGRCYVNFCWDDNTLVRAIFRVSPEEAPSDTTDRQPSPREVTNDSI